MKRVSGEPFGASENAPVEVTLDCGGRPDAWTQRFIDHPEEIGEFRVWGIEGGLRESEKGRERGRKSEGSSWTSQQTQEEERRVDFIGTMPARGLV